MTNERLSEMRRDASMTQGAYCLPGPEMIALLDELERLQQMFAELRAIVSETK